MAVKLIVPGVVPVALPQYPEHVAAWRSVKEPPPRWYKTFSSMQYNIRRVLRPPAAAGEHPAVHPWHYVLTPVVGRPVYTFNEIESFIEASREFTVALFTTAFTDGVAQYRVHIGPPREHTVYRLPPDWTWNDDGTTKNFHLP